MQNAIFIFIIVFLFTYVFSAYLRRVQPDNYIYLFPGIGLGTLCGTFYLYGHYYSNGKIGAPVINIVLSASVAALLGTLSSKVSASEK
ncbi:hypothetical protein [Bacillus toyonensis]|uniref:hypothetical protein n=1 Tax=Bacillus toyonensis TaxID=155322 RepID=UPI002E1C5F77|nr:hypothetical protein [Bacillus toyonensis]